MSLSNYRAAELWLDEPAGSTYHRKGGNVSFDGDCFYSYSTKIAEKYAADDGSDFILMTRWTYSVSTAKHKNYLHREANRLIIISLAGDYHVSLSQHLLNAVVEMNELENICKKPEKCSIVLLRSYLQDWLILANGLKQIFELAKNRLKKELRPEDRKLIKEKINKAEKMRAAWKEDPGFFGTGSGFGYIYQIHQNIKRARPAFLNQLK